MIITNDGTLKKVEAQDIKNGILAIPENVVTMGSFSMNDISFLKEIIIPSSVKFLKANCIKGRGLTKIVVPSTVKKIEDYAFEEALDLRFLELFPDTDFTEKAFYRCYKLNKLKVGLINYSMCCLEFGSPYVIISKKENPPYQIYECVKYRRGNKEKEKLYCAGKGNSLGCGCTLDRAIKDCEKRSANPNVKQAYANITLDAHIDSIDFRRIVNLREEETIKLMNILGYKINDVFSVREIMSKLEEGSIKQFFAQFIADRYAERARGG